MKRRLLSICVVLSVILSSIMPAQKASASKEVYVNSKYVNLVTKERLGIGETIGLGTRCPLSGKIILKKMYSYVTISLENGNTCFQSAGFKVEQNNGYQTDTSINISKILEVHKFNQLITFSTLEEGDYTLSIYAKIGKKTVKLIEIPFSIKFTEEQRNIVNNFYSYMIDQLYMIATIKATSSAENAFGVFYKSAQPNGEWDVKELLGTYREYKYPYINDNEPVTGEALGNILYGFVGSYLLDLDMLLRGGSYASGLSVSKALAVINLFIDKGDSEYDRKYIILGNELYVEYINGYPTPFPVPTTELEPTITPHPTEAPTPTASTNIDYSIGEVVYISGTVCANSDGSGNQVYKGPDHTVIITHINAYAPYAIGFKYPGTSIERYGWISVNCVRKFNEWPTPEPTPENTSVPVLIQEPLPTTEPTPTPVADYSIGDVVYISGMVYANSDGSGRQVYKGPDHEVIITHINADAPYSIGFKYPGTNIPRYGWISVDCIHR